MKNKKGFTLVEVLAVITLLGLLSSIAIVSISRYRLKALEDEKKSLRGSIVSAFNNYRITQSVNKAYRDENTHTLVTEADGSVKNNVALSSLTFDKPLKYDGKLCNLSESYAYYVVQGDLDSSLPSKAEETCVYLKCDGKVIVDDTVKVESSCNKGNVYSESEQEVEPDTDEPVEQPADTQ